MEKPRHFASRYLLIFQAKKKVQDDIKAKQAVPDDDALALGVAEAQLGVLRTQQQNEIIKAVLSPEQQQTWNEFQAKRESFLQKRTPSNGRLDAATF